MASVKSSTVSLVATAIVLVVSAVWAVVGLVLWVAAHAHLVLGVLVVIVVLAVRALLHAARRGWLR